MIDRDDVCHCIRTLFTLNNYSTGFMNKYYCQMSIYFFILRHWKGWGYRVFLLIEGILTINALSSLFIMQLMHIYTIVSIIAFIFSLIYIIHDFVKTIDNIEGLDNFVIDDQTVLSDVCVKDENCIIDGYVHFSKLVSSKELIEIKLSGVCENIIEFDEGISNALLDKNVIKYRELNENDKNIMKVNYGIKEIQLASLIIHKKLAIQRSISFFNAKKISLVSMSVSDSNEVESTISQTSYFCSFLTNDISTKCIQRLGKIVSRANLNLFPAERKYDIITNKEEFNILSISDTKGISNHIGSVVLAISKDNIPIFCTQNKNANVNSNRYVLSGSGSLEFKDLKNSGADEKNDLAEAIRYGMARELLEETNGIIQDSFRKKDIKKILEYKDKIQLAGYYRDLRRGGLPIFFGFCKMDENYSEVIRRKDTGPCPWAAKTETDIFYISDIGDMPIITKSSDMIALIDEYAKPKKDYVRKPSDQVLIYKELLKYESVKKHFKKIYE